MDVGCSGIGRDHALFEDEAAVKAPFAGGNHRIGLFGLLVKRHALHRTHGPVAALGLVDSGLHLLLDDRQFGGVTDHLHALDRRVHKAVQREDGEDCAHRLRNVRTVQPKYFP